MVLVAPASNATATLGGGGGGGGGFGGPGDGRGSAYTEPGTVDFEDSFVEQAGMMPNYDLLGLKTLVQERRVQAARRSHHPQPQHHCQVPAVAYLQAKLKNSSKLTPFKGSSGPTLDGSFMGRAKIPRCSPGNVFTLSLGIDIAIKVSYPKPDVHRTTTGLFNKERSSDFARLVLLHDACET